MERMIEHTSLVRVRYAETDQMKYAHHANYIIWFELARIELMRAVGISYADLEKKGYLLPVLEVGATYLRPARFDDQLKIVARLSQKPRAKFRIEYEVINEQEDVICSGYSSHGFISADYKATRPPRSFMQALEPYF